MKRRFKEVDEHVVREVSFLSKESQVSQQLGRSLQRLQRCESAIDERVLLETRVRLSAGVTDERASHTQTQTHALLRLFARHVFVPREGEGERDRDSHYVVTLEGMLVVAAEKRRDFALNQFLQSVKVGIERKQGSGINTMITSQDFFWAEQQFPSGCQANCITFRVPGDKADKSCIAHFVITLNSESTNKFRTSEMLRTNFPFFPLEVTEEELSLGILQYIGRNNLLVGRDTRTIECDQPLRNILDGCDQFQVSNLRIKLLKHLMPSDPIEFDLPLTTIVTTETVQNTIIGCGQTSVTQLFSKIGGRTIDIEVLIHNNDKTCSYIDEINKLPYSAYNAKNKQAKLQAKAEFISREIAEDIVLLSELQKIIELPTITLKSFAKDEQCEKELFPQIPLPYDLIHSRPRRTQQGKYVSPPYSLGQPLRTINTSLHAFASFLDVGSDNLFDSSQLWLQEICKTLDDRNSRKQNQPATSSPIDASTTV